MHPLTSSIVARELGLSRERVLQLDWLLQPRRSETGVRIYTQSNIDAALGWRAVMSTRPLHQRSH